MPDSLDQYRQEHLDHPILTDADEKALLDRCCNGDPEAIDELVRANQRLVMKCARRYYYSGMAGDLELMDLVQAGNIGLLEAIRRWDRSRKTRFSTYATWWVRANIRRMSLTQGTPIPRTAREGDLVVAVHKARSALTARLSRDPRPAEIAAEAGISLPLCLTILPMLEAPLPWEYEDRQGRSIDELTPGPYDTAAEAETRLQRQDLLEALEALPYQQRFILEHRLPMDGRKPLSYKEIGKRLGISHVRVQRLEQSALTDLGDRLLP
jgi:RNA polymerase sigma factor (sigma-70 family)